MKDVDQDKLDRVNKQIEVYKKRIANERAKIQQANEQIVGHERSKVLERKVGGGETSTLTKIETEKKILIDRLNNKLAGLNKKISNNKQLRAKIDEMVSCKSTILYVDPQISQAYTLTVFFPGTYLYIRSCPDTTETRAS
jgi:hypothetical protein